MLYYRVIKLFFVGKEEENVYKLTSDLGNNVPIDALIFLRPTCFSSTTHGLKKEDSKEVLNGKSKQSYITYTKFSLLGLR